MSWSQGFPNSFSPTQQTQEVLKNTDNETKRIYQIISEFMAANGHAHTGNGNDGSTIDVSDIPGLNNYSFSLKAYEIIAKSPNGDIRAFGGIGDGTTDNTSFFSDAISFLELTGGLILIPPGTFIIGDVVLKSNISFIGCGVNSKLKFKSGATNMFIVNSGSADVLNNTENVSFSNMQTIGRNTEDGFEEHNHLFNLSGVTNFLFYRVLFYDWQGDACYFGSGTTGQERHNKQIFIEKCIFDGKSNNNRNGITFIDVDGALVEDNVFVNIAKSNMPGAIDLEPNLNPWHIIKNATIRNNKFRKIGGNVGVISYQLPLPQSGLTNFSENIIVKENDIDLADSPSGNNLNSGISIVQNGTVAITEATQSNNIKLINNDVKNINSYPLKILGIKSIFIGNNRFQDCSNAGLLGFTGAQNNNIDVTFKDNTFRRCGSTTGSGMTVFTVKNLNLQNNIFDDCGTGVVGSSNSINFGIGTSSYVTLSGNTFITPTGKTLIAVQKESGHIFTPSTNSFYGNALNGLVSFFQVTGGSQAVAAYNAELTSWVPILTGGSSAGSGTYTTQSGTFNQIGKIVFFQATIIWTAHTGTGQIYINLPVSANSSNVLFAPAVIASSGITVSAGAQICALFNPPLSRMQLYTSNAGVLSSLSVPPSGTLYISGTYVSS